MSPLNYVLLSLLLDSLVSSATAIKIPKFEDVADAVGIKQDKWNKYGGPIVADLDSDGHYDLILTFHKFAPLQIYFGSASGNFTKAPFTTMQDIHGVSVAPRTATSLGMLIYVSVGGAGGKVPTLSTVLRTGPKRRITDISDTVPLFNVRGRISMFMNLALQSKAKNIRNLGGPDLLVANFLGNKKGTLETTIQYAYQNIKGRLRYRDVPGFQNETQGRADLTDIDGDGVMEIVSFQEFRIYKLVNPFQFIEVSSTVAPGISPADFTVNAMVEFDMDNDGDFDVYLARGFEDLVSNRNENGRVAYPDLLLENRNGQCVDVSRKANILGKSRSLGVSAGDFNNDGYVDLIVTQFQGPDVLLINKGDGTFKHVNPQIPKPRSTSGDNSLAVDYDLDGCVDLITGQGNRLDYVGKFLLMRNVMTLDSRSHFLLVRVGNDPGLICTALHALVTVVTKKITMVRRVASRGSQKQGGGSFLDTVHFGLGAAGRVRRVTVRWSSGTTRSVQNVKADRKISLGRFVTAQG